MAAANRPVVQAISLGAVATGSSSKVRLAHHFCSGSRQTAPSRMGIAGKPRIQAEFYQPRASFPVRRRCAPAHPTPDLIAELQCIKDENLLRSSPPKPGRCRFCCRLPVTDGFNQYPITFSSLAATYNPAPPSRRRWRPARVHEVVLGTLDR